ncbi:tetratricopeptide repeat protein [Pseudobacteriovorax antillogorgiicola]|uniref:Tetratricopeptide repeat-containing protein n=1 Tax=Pseudobacteriovorax antillogorgiicola TaxID=1513793 RepID=A0A1Y6BL03_9BACT|nr:tetratricopeptide repeat protein [Pseudobacteriovorax antillogorgiicola]TCS54641.1 tetratricopeptide repeat protein [Pseudobacteriovorax antillogorgiicola]SMF17032.1 Tetratricopeptide repeat-containing protein [Pseudobacteriovorax antillogorgiicola]
MELEISRRNVLAISNDNQNKNFIRKALAMANYKVSFISSMMEVGDAIFQFKPAGLVHDWAAVDEGQARHFHLKFTQKEIGRGVVRIILVPEVTTEMIVFSYDAMVEKVMSYSNAALNLGSELDQLYYKQDSTDIPNLLTRIRFSGQYSQQDIDNEIMDAIKKYPNETNVQLEFGALCLREEEYDKSAHYSRDVLHKEPHNVRAMNLLSRSLMKQGNLEHATQILEKANILSPKNPDRLLLLGDAFYGKGDVTKALSYYQQAKSSDSDVALEADRRSGQVMLEDGQLESALSLFKSSLSEEESASIFNNVAVSKVQEGEMETALELYKTALKALKTDRYKVQVFFNISLCYYKMRDHESAQKFIRKCLRIDPKFEKANSLAKKLKVVA